VRRYLSSELKPGEFMVTDNEPHRVDWDPGVRETLRDKLARCISDSYSPQPGRLCLVKQDYRAADDVIALLLREGITWS
jgi:hypothetical protein